MSHDGAHYLNFWSASKVDTQLVNQGFIKQQEPYRAVNSELGVCVHKNLLFDQPYGYIELPDYVNGILTISCDTPTTTIVKATVTLGE